MIYTDDVKKELDAILKAFENYIDGQDYFDIVLLAYRDGAGEYLCK